MYLELKNINKKFGDYQASDQVSFSIEKGTLAALLGPSGSVSNIRTAEMSSLMVSVSTMCRSRSAESDLYFRTMRSFPI